MSRWEGRFAASFKRHHVNPGQTFDYTQEHALCALSIVWRVLAHQRAHPELNHLTFGSDYSRTDDASQVWTDVLLGVRPHPGQFRLNWLWFDHVTNGPPDINRYIFHACDFDVWASAKRSYAVAHLPGIFLVGALENFPRGEFRGFDVSFSGGRYQAFGQKQAPAWLQGYMERKMEARREAIAQLSPAQQAKIQKTVLADPKRALSSPLFRSTLYDMGLRPDEG